MTIRPTICIPSHYSEETVAWESLRTDLGHIARVGFSRDWCAKFEGMGPCWKALDMQPNLRHMRTIQSYGFRRLRFKDRKADAGRAGVSIFRSHPLSEYLCFPSDTIRQRFASNQSWVGNLNEGEICLCSILAFSGLPVLRSSL